MSPTLKRYNGSSFDYVGQVSVYNSGPAATLAYAEVTASQGSITTATDLTGLSVTVTVPAGRRIRISSQVTVQNSTAATLNAIYIMEGATILQKSFIVSGASSETLTTEVVLSPTAGTHTYKLRADRAAGTLTMFASVEDIAFILVEDVTGSTLPYNPASVPVGTLAQASLAASVSGIGATPVALGVSANVVVPAGRTLRISATCVASVNNSGDEHGNLVIKQDGTAIGQGRIVARVALFNLTASVSVTVSPSAGAHVYHLEFQREGGTGTWTVLGGNSTAPCLLLVEDITPTPSASTGAPGSTLGYAQVTADQTGISTSTVDLTNLSVTVTVPAGRRIRITGQALFNKLTAGGWAVLGINEGASIYGEGYVEPAVGDYNSATATAIISPSAGTHTYKLTAVAENASATMVANAAHPAFILVEDITGSVWPTGSSVTAGMVASEQWTDFTPTLAQGATNNIAKTVTYSRYIRFGRLIQFNMRLDVTGTGTASNAILINLPVVPVTAPVTIGLQIGTGRVYDASAPNVYKGFAILQSDNLVRIEGSTSSAGGGLGAAVMTAALASGDAVELNVTYEAAS